MASRSNSTLKVYGTIVCRQLKRGFSSAQPSVQRATVSIADDENRSAVTQLLKPQNKTFPFPGDVCIALNYDQAKPKPVTIPTVKLEDLLKSDVPPVISALHNETTPAAEEEKEQLELESHEMEQNVTLELTAMDCPPGLKRDLIGMFPDQKLTGQSKMTVLNLTQKSDNDMSAWSLQMEMERDRLTAGFIESAMNICEQLKQDGFWADFIDPTSGRAFLGSFTNSTLFETDERYNQLGFNVEDLGCCKVVKHVLWGSCVFVGTIFTNAPLEADAIKNVLSKVNES